MRLTIAAFGLMLTACYSNSDGISPPLDKIYFPVGLSTDCNPHAFRPTAATATAASPTADETACKSNYLYVVSSDFDLQFNAGSIQALDLAVVRKLIPSECANDEQCQTISADWVCDTYESRLASNIGVAVPPSYTCVPADTRVPCGALGLQSAADRVLVPGLCKSVDLSYVDVSATGDRAPLLHDQVGIGAFATDGFLSYAPEWIKNPDETASVDEQGNPSRLRRLLVPVRGEASLHWIDIDSQGYLDCGQTRGDAKAACNHSHRVGTDAAENTRNVRMPPEPFAIATSDAGDAIIVTHQTQGSVSLFTQGLASFETWHAGPRLEYIQTVSAQQALAVAAIPEPELVRAKRGQWLSCQSQGGTTSDDCSGAPDTDPYPPGFLVAYGNAAQVDLLRYMSDNQASVARPYLQGAQAVGIRANAADTNSRGIVFDDTTRRHCDAACLSDAGSTQPSADCPANTTALDCCRAKCAKLSSGVYVTSRSPASLLVGVTTPASADIPAVTAYTPPRDTPQFTEVVPLALGPSRAYVGKIVNEAGELETRIFVVCYDERQVIIYDPATDRVEGYIKTGRGPHAMAFDYYDPGQAARDSGIPARALAYVGHFFDSYVGVIQLDRRKIRTYGNIVLSLAPAVAPRASK